MLKNIQQLYRIYLNRHLNHKEIDYFKLLIYNQQYNKQFIIKHILNSQEYLIKSIKNLKKYIQLLYKDQESVKTYKDADLITLLKQNISVKKIKQIIYEEYKSSIDKKHKTIQKHNNYINENPIDITDVHSLYQSIVKRNVTQKEINNIQMNNLTLQDVKNDLIFSQEYSDLLDKQLIQYI